MTCGRRPIGHNEKPATGVRRGLCDDVSLPVICPTCQTVSGSSIEPRSRKLRARQLKSPLPNVRRGLHDFRDDVILQVICPTCQAPFRPTQGQAVSTRHAIGRQPANWRASNASIGRRVIFPVGDSARRETLHRVRSDGRNFLDRPALTAVCERS